MEKLKVLLNKFLKTKPYKREFKSNEEIDKYGVLIISKQFEFIAWLVKNNMIDLDKVGKRFNDVLYNDRACEGLIAEAVVLMTLAISDEPIKFLISILK